MQPGSAARLPPARAAAQLAEREAEGRTPCWSGGAAGPGSNSRPCRCHTTFGLPCCQQCTHHALLAPDTLPQAGCCLLDSLPWNLFILAITLFAVFAPDIAIITSGALCLLRLVALLPCCPRCTHASAGLLWWPVLLEPRPVALHCAVAQSACSRP